MVDRRYGMKIARFIILVLLVTVKAYGQDFQILKLYKADSNRNFSTVEYRYDDSSRSRRSVLQVNDAMSSIAKALVFSGDDSLLAAYDHRNVIWIYSVTERRLLITLRMVDYDRYFHDHGISVEDISMQFSNDNRYFTAAATLSGPDALITWDLDSGRPLVELYADGPLLIPTDDPHLVYAADFKNSGTLITMDHGRITESPLPYDGDLSDKGPRSLGRLIDGTKVLIQDDLYTFPGFEDITSSRADRGFSYSSGNRFHADRESDTSVRLFDSLTGDQIGIFNGLTRSATSFSKPLSIAISSDGTRVAGSAGGGGDIIVWDSGSGSFEGYLNDPRGAVSGLALSPGGILASGYGKSWDWTDDDRARISQALVLWNLTREEEIEKLGTMPVIPFDFDYDLHRNLLLVGGFDDSVRLADGGTGEVLITVNHNLSGRNWNELFLKFVEFLPGSDTFVTLGNQAPRDPWWYARFWSIGDGSLEREYKLISHKVKLFEVSPDGKWMTSESENRIHGVWDTKDPLARDGLTEFTDHIDNISDAAFSPDGKYMVSASDDQGLKIYDVLARRMLRPLGAHNEAATAVAWSEGGSFIVSGAQRGQVMVFDGNRYRLLSTLDRTHTGSVVDVAIAADETSFATVGEDGMIRIRSLPDGRLLHSHSLHEGQSISVRYVGPRNAVVSAGLDGKFVIFRPDTGLWAELRYYEDGSWNIIDSLNRFNGSPAGIERISSVIGLRLHSADETGERVEDLLGRILRD